ncbi:MAG: tRNA-queuosine alpha-mannosyltransferase domain-containing protein, partial [Caldilineaceae bacterium]
MQTIVQDSRLAAGGQIRRVTYGIHCAARGLAGRRRARYHGLMNPDRPPTAAPSESSRNIWLLSAYHTGSHRAWALGWQAHSRHTVRLLTLEGRFWKWRMLGGAVDLAQMAAAELALSGPPDVVVATDMVNLPVWLAGMRRLLPPMTPLLLYMHENQLTYPWRPGEQRDPAYALINWQSQLAADAIVFNSLWHQQSWFDELPRLLKHYPDYGHLPLVEG